MELFKKLTPKTSQEYHIWRDAIREYPQNPLASLTKLRGILDMRDYQEKEQSKIIFDYKTPAQTTKRMEWINEIKQIQKEQNLTWKDAFKQASQKRKLLKGNNAKTKEFSTPSTTITTSS